MKKILIVSKAIPPSLRASAMVMNNLATGLEPEQVVLVGEKPYCPQKGTSTVNCKTFYLGTSLASYLPAGRKYFKWIKTLEYPLIRKKINTIVRKEGVEVILGVFPDAYYLSLALEVAKQHDLPLITYFHNTYLENSSQKAKAKKLEEALFSYAALNLAISDGLRDFYRERDQSLNFKTLTHAFEIPAYWPLTKYVREEPLMKIAFSGSFNETCYDATERFVNAMDEKRCRLSYFTKVPEQVLKDKNIGTNYIYRGLVPWQDLRSALNAHDYCLITHGFSGGLSEVEYKTIFPTRLIPLLYSGVPLIAVCPKDSFLSKFLLKHDCALLLNEQTVNEAQNILDVLDQDIARKRQLVANAYRVCERFKISAVSDQLLDYVKEVTLQRPQAVKKN